MRFIIGIFLQDFCSSVTTGVGESGMLTMAVDSPSQPLGVAREGAFGGNQTRARQGSREDSHDEREISIRETGAMERI